MTGFLSCPFQISADTYEAESSAFFARLGTQPTDVRKATYNTMILALKNAGVWTKLDVLYLFAASIQATALTNLVQSSYGGINFPGSPATFNVDLGFDGNGTGRLIQSQFTPSTAPSPKYVQDSASLFAWRNTSGNVDDTPCMAAGGGGILAYLIPRHSFGGNIYGSMNDATDINPLNNLSAADGKGLFTFTRTASTTRSVYYNAGLLRTDSEASTGVPTTEVQFRNFVGNTNACLSQYNAAGIGSGLTAQNVTDLYNALHTYLQTVAGFA